jgi:hypothetical protein
LAALQSAIDAQDWETATTHCAKAMSLPPDVVAGPFAENAVVRIHSTLQLYDLSNLPMRIAYVRESLTSCPNIARSTGEAAGYLPAEVRRSVTVSRLDGYYAVLQIVPGYRMGGRGSRSVRSVCGRLGTD